MGRPSNRMVIEPFNTTSLDDMYVASIAPEGASFPTKAIEQGLVRKLTLPGINTTMGAVAAFYSLGIKEHWVVPIVNSDELVFDMYLRVSDLSGLENSLR
ncbi:MAG: hypothetical protein WCV90_06680 [Candidatus Woesearchaeota archaeon]